MKQLYSARNGLEAHELRLFLESQGIAVKVFGDTNALESIFDFTPWSAPGVFVDEADFERATGLLDKFFEAKPAPGAARTWTCASCGERIESQFDACWNCESPRGNAPIDPLIGPPVVASDSPQSIVVNPGNKGLPERCQDQALSSHRKGTTRSDAREIWLELLAVLTICWLPLFVQSAFDLYLPYEQSHRPYLARLIPTMTLDVSLIVLVLYIIYRSGEPLTQFGIRRPRLLLEIAIALAAFALNRLVFRISFDVVSGIVDVRSLPYPPVPIPGVTDPAGALQWSAATVSILIGAFSEELIFRGYMIGRFKQLLGSTWISVALSSVFYGLGHLYQGWDRVFITFMSGIAYGCVFCVSGRIWPTFLAHAYYNMLLSFRY